MHAWVEDVDFGIGFDIAGSNFAFAFCFNIDCLRPVSVQLCRKTLKTQNDFCYVLFYARDRRQFMVYAVNFYGVDCDTGQRGEQHTPQAITKCGSVATFQWC